MQRALQALQGLLGPLERQAILVLLDQLVTQVQQVRLVQQVQLVIPDQQDLLVLQVRLSRLRLATQASTYRQMALQLAGRQ